MPNFSSSAAFSAAFAASDPELVVSEKDQLLAKLGITEAEAKLLLG